MDINQVIQDLNNVRQEKRQYIWESFMREYNCQIVCEIGVQRGVNFANFIQHTPQLAVAVDCWIDDEVASRNDGRASQSDLDEQFESFKQSVSGKSFVKIYRDYSFEAVKNFEDNYFDVVYIDADHSYEGCLRDINDWYPKVKPSKFLLGDDYRVSKYTRTRFGVIEAVNEFAKKNNLEFIELVNYGWGIIKK